MIKKLFYFHLSDGMWHKIIVSIDENKRDFDIKVFLDGLLIPNPLGGDTDSIIIPIEQWERDEHYNET